MTLAPGTKLGPYTIRAPLGAGGMGEVYRAEDERLGREVAVKILPEALRGDRDRLRRFEQEARAAASLSHPNILAVHDFSLEGDVAYLVSELLEGSSLRALLDAGPMPWRRALHLAEQLASGLAAAHAKGIVHRDLKPENLFVLRDQRLKILDFGLAKSLPPSITSPSAPGTPPPPGGTLSGSELTATGAVLGSAGYMAPEQVQGRAADHRADFFAFGAVLYEMVSGRRAFPGATAVEKAYGILHDEPAPLGLEVPRGLAEIVRRCLAKDPAQRFQSASDLTFVLSAIAAASDAPASAPTAPPGSVPTAYAPTAIRPAEAEKKPRLSRFTRGTLITLFGALLLSVILDDGPKKKHTEAPSIPDPPAVEDIEDQLRAASEAAQKARELDVHGKVLGLRVDDAQIERLVKRLQRAHKENGELVLEDGATYEQLTFRHGSVPNARFSPDGASVLYAALTEDGVLQTYTVVPGNPESRPLLDPGILLHSVSRTGELALGVRARGLAAPVAGLDLRARDELTTLARAPLAGGAPRIVLEDVAEAEWSPDGRALAVVLRTAESMFSGNRVEYPIGTLRYETTGWVSDLRIAPKGDMIAFADHPIPGDDKGTIKIVGADGAARTLGREWTSLRGLAWDAKGRELWFTAAEGFSRSLWAIDLDGHVRAVARVPANLQLLDLDAAGRALVKRVHWRMGIRTVVASGEEQEAGWFDAPFRPILSTKGSALAFTEWSDATGGEPRVYFRPQAGAPAVPLGPGSALDLSSDEAWVLAVGPKSDHLSLLPTGAGTMRDVPTPGLSYVAAAHFERGDESLFVLGQRGKEPLRWWRVRVAGGELEPFGPDAIARVHGRGAISPSGDTVLTREGSKLVAVAVKGGARRELTASRDVVEIAGWSANERAVFAVRTTPKEIVIERIELATGKVTRVRGLSPPGGRALVAVHDVTAVDDGRRVAYCYWTIDERLFLAEGLF
ncbi:protein kinase [Myxococcota bacterium]|nr:protein kinase [Myxococcota bacterium]